jgi:hypothetical protein
MAVANDKFPLIALLGVIAGSTLAMPLSAQQSDYRSILAAVFRKPLARES